LFAVALLAGMAGVLQTGVERRLGLAVLGVYLDGKVGETVLRHALSGNGC
jgi:hypothetical protein